MIIESLIGLSLVLNVSLEKVSPPNTTFTWLHMMTLPRDAALLPLVQRATDCILRRASADPRDHADMRPDEINDLIVDSIAACADSVRAMIRTHDRRYGRGSGETFLLGPYLDVMRQINSKAR